MEIRLVGPSAWKPDVARYGQPPAPGRLPGETSRLAHAVLWTLQDAHVGITPRLAHDLARVFVEPGLRAGVGPGRPAAARASDHPIVWSRLLRRLQDSLPRTDRSGLVAGNVPAYIVLKVVKPIVRESCRQLGYGCLLCHDEPASGVTAEEYAAYGAALEREVSRAAERMAAGPLFATEHGNVIAALSEPSPHGRSRTSVPELDRASLAMLLGLEAEIDVPARASRRTPAPTYVSRSRPSPGDQEGRIEGLRHSRGEAHFGSIVLSEFLNHPVVLVDRLLNSGYLVHERRPRREKLRDVLVVGLMPQAVRATLQGSFAKACWLDCMARLGQVLAGARLGDSEFRWIEGDLSGRARCCSFPLGQLPADLASGGAQAFRRAFVTVLRWLPDYFDTRAGFRAIGIKPSASPEQWAVGAWAANAEPRVAPMERFSFVHVMVFHPSMGMESGAHAAGAKRLGTLRAGLRLGYSPRRHTSVTYVSGDGDRTPWHFGAGTDPYRALAAGDGGALSRQLQATWLDQLTREIWHG
jgi:hypothetical protein